MKHVTPFSAVDRRTFLRQSGCLAIGFSLFPASACSSHTNEGDQTQQAETLQEELADADHINAWLRLREDNSVTVLTGKIEIGQGVLVALRQIAAEELDVPLARVEVVMADTGQTPDERYTAGSASIESSGMAIRQAAAEARQQLLERAAQRFNVPVAQLSVTDGTVRVAQGTGEVTYGALLAGEQLTGKISGKAPLKNPQTYRLVGTPQHRPEIVAMATGAPGYVHDLRLPNMVHARVLRPSVYRATLQSLLEDKIKAMPGVLQLVRDGNFAAVLAEGEYQAIRAWQVLKAEATWQEPEPLPEQQHLFRDIPNRVTRSETVENAPDLDKALDRATTRWEATYERPYHLHGSIGPSCALAEWKDERLTVWTHSQGVYPLRDSIAQMLQLREGQVRVIGVRGSGCYGHNGADDVAADAARLALALPGRPVRVQWMREDEHGWEPYGSAMVLQLRGGLDATGKIVAWETQLWTDAHSHRPGGNAAELLAAQYLENAHLPPDEGGYLGGGYRNATPFYQIPSVHIEAHQFVGPLRVSALRSLGAYANIFALESFMDELAVRAGDDPVAFRLRHLQDERARAVIEEVARQVQWQAQRPEQGRGWGVAFAQYKNRAAYFAVAAEVAYDAEKRDLRVLRLVGAIDAGQVINPDGLKNQTEGGMVQSTSWTTLEQVTWNETRITSRDWESYPILRFPHLPKVDVTVLDRPELPPLGAGEAAQGPTAAAIANAVYRATGTRVRELPITAARL
ncbi:CO or xanthine dehydrogenase, Mo-binding subunit [Catalinimonas alkaloidigena]|uniref:CO or xanthine dehydrogenase, Mo-binding subunit n=1 Tax=Catalinimonas alkaloidigena TaxID=1075417 RepID=A0A1G9S806_9BACT|nr:molybdopterin cofactor-binding domain-containing protein [Catalinimonas alkaloidigena]SDM31596.1 CO or xanthine dehydrogenase, Mo-binding subunit [Catalinimonas alkaloidigena]